MRLPNGDRAIVDIRKLRNYCLNPHHLRGRNKARVFASVGIREPDAEILRSALLDAAVNADSQLGSQDEFGQRFFIDFDLTRHARTVSVRSAWIIRYVL